MRALRSIQLIIIIIFCSCGTQNSKISKPSATITISPAATTLLDVIVGKFPGITVIGDNVANGNPKILIRGGSLSINNQAYAIFDIDGSIQEGNVSPKAFQVSIFPILPSVTWNFSF